MLVSEDGLDFLHRFLLEFSFSHNGKDGIRRVRDVEGKTVREASLDGIIEGF